MSNQREDTSAIHDMIQTYLDALYHADVSKLASVIRDDGLYVSTSPDDYLNRTIPEYLAVVSMRQSPASQGETRNEEIVSIEFAGDTMAFVRLNMSMMGRSYTDFLTLYKDAGQWQIISKIFTYTTRSA